MRDLIRQVLHGYKSLKLEGQGEGYVQFSAEDPDSKQTVTIKILPRVLSRDPKIATQFDALARLIRQLNHPNIASIRKVGEQAGLPYIVTRALEKGQPLAAKLDQLWAVDEAADVVMQAGRALEHAYNKGMVHGALTPENVAVQDDGRVLVTDFGLNQLVELAGGQLKRVASPYLAPERMAGADGRPAAADARADVYSLAAILYTMLAKRAPLVVKGEVLPPGRFNPDLPKAMDEVIVKALAPDPAERYPDVKTFLLALGAITLVPAGEQAQPVTGGQRCPHCGAEGQKGHFCRKCGRRLEPTAAAPSAAAAPAALTYRVEKARTDQPIQVTKVEVGRVEVGKGVEMGETIVAQPTAQTPVTASTAPGELAAGFPQPLEMPQLDMQSLWPSLGDRAPGVGAGPSIAMPEPPAMPVIDWAEIAPPMPEVPRVEPSGADAAPPAAARDRQAGEEKE